MVKGQNRSTPLAPKILTNLHAASVLDDKYSLEVCALDAMWLGLQTGYCCSEYCKQGSPTNPNDQFSCVLNTNYTWAFVAFPLVFIPVDLDFLSKSKHILHYSVAKTDTMCIWARFKFGICRTGNLSHCVFKRFAKSQEAFCPLLVTPWALC